MKNMWKIHPENTIKIGIGIENWNQTSNRMTVEHKLCTESYVFVFIYISKYVYVKIDIFLCSEYKFLAFNLFYQSKALSLT